MNNRKIRGVIPLLLLFFYLMTPILGYAHNSFFLQSLVDDNKFMYQGNVIEDKARSFNSEAKHIEAELGNFKNLISSNNIATPADKDSYSDNDPLTKGVNTDIMPFTFPAKEDGGGMFSNIKKNDATSADADRAYLIKETLMPGINDALLLLNKGERFTSQADLMKMAQKLTSSTSVNGFTIAYGATAGWHKKPTDKSTGAEVNADPLTGITASDYVLIKNTSTSEEFEFAYRMRKGYKASSDVLYNSLRSSLSGDTEFITWNMLIYQANYSYAVKGFTAKDGSSFVKPGPLESAVVGFFENTFTSLRNLLGLYSIDELVYNEGARGSSMWYYGTMNKDWADNITIYYWIFQGIAWSLIGLAILKALIQRNIATINPSMRVSLIENIQDLLITGFILANIFPIINMFMYMNIRLVDVFGSVSVGFSKMADVNNYSNAIGGIIIQFFYLIVTCYLNFVYIMRAITLALLIASAPLFVVTIAFGGKWKMLFGMWMREILSNIFLQSFHAFMLSFFVSIQVSTRGVEGMVLAFALIPMTEFFRGMIMGQGGGFATKMGLGAVSAGASMVGASMGVGVNKSKQDGGKQQGFTKDGNNIGGQAGDSSKIGGNQSSQGLDLSKSQISNDLKQANKATGVPINKFKDIDDMQMHDDKFSFGKQGGGEDGEPNKVFDAIKENAGGVAMGALKVGAGVAIGMALGGSDSQMANMATKMVGTGGAGISGGVKNVGREASSEVKQMIGSAKAQRQDNNNVGSTPPNSELYRREIPNNRDRNGDIEVHKDGNVMRQQGVERANMDSAGNANFTYNKAQLQNQDNKYGSSDAKNLETYAKTFHSGTKEEKQSLRQQGIEGVSKNSDGNFMVSYNKTGMKNLGISNVQTMGDGRIVERKAYNAPETVKTFKVNPNLPPKQEQNNNGGGREA